MNKFLVAIGLFCIIVISLASAMENSDDQKIIVTLKSADEKFSALSVVEDIQDLTGKYDVAYVAETTPEISINVNAEELAELEKRDDVESIRPAHDFKLFLQDSAPLIGANTVQSLQIDGVSLTGSGQTVCVIDSGIDYTHPDLGGCTREEFLSGSCEKVVGGYAFYDNATSDKNDIMDTWQHGTHISGIIAANGGIKGVAPGARLVGTKACSTGFCDDLAVLDSLNWCLANADQYDISVISMSLGYDLYSSHAACDALDPAYTAAFAQAAAQDISVIVASGNGGTQAGTAYPACLSNATAVAATTKSDTIAGFSDRSPSLVSLVAPGSGITSTSMNGGYAGLSGTSQAVPHVSGAIAIIRQILSEQGRTMSSPEIISMLVDTGKTINDGSSSYKRIDVYQAALSLDNVAPTISLEGPANGLNTTDSAFTFGASATDWGLASMVFQLRDNSGNIVNQGNFALSGTSDSDSISISNLAPGTYTWEFSVNDTRSNINSQFRTLTVSPADNPTNTTNSSPPSQNVTNQTVTMGLNGFVINNPVQGGTYNDSVLINISQGTATRVNYSINDGSFIVYTTPAAFSLPAGSSTLTVRASNSAFFNQTSVSFNVVNTTTVNQNPPPSQNVTNQTVTMGLNGFVINNPVQGGTYNDSVLINISQGTATRVNYSINDGSYVSYSSPTVIFLGVGGHTLNVRASTASEFNQTSVSFNIVNTTPVNQNPTNETNQTNNTNQTQNPQPNPSPSPAPTLSGRGGSSGGGGGGGSSSTTKSVNYSTVNAQGALTSNISANNSNVSINFILNGSTNTADLPKNISLLTGNTINIPEKNKTTNSTIWSIPKRIQHAIERFFKSLIASLSRLF